MKPVSTVADLQQSPRGFSFFCRQACSEGPFIPSRLEPLIWTCSKENGNGHLGVLIADVLVALNCNALVGR